MKSTRQCVNFSRTLRISSLQLAKVSSSTNFATISSSRYSTTSQVPSGLTLQNEAANILPDEYFQNEVYKSHNDRKVAQLGDDVQALKREIFLDAIEKDLNQLNKMGDTNRVKSLLNEFIPKRGITSYGLLHALRCLRDAGQSDEGIKYFIQMRNMGSPPSLRNLPIVTEIVKTSMATGREDVIIEAIADYATIFPEDKVLWMSIFDFATQSNLERLHIELTNIYDRYQSQFAKDNALKIRMIRFFDKCQDSVRAEKVRKSIITPTKFSKDRDLFHALKDLVDANDLKSAHTLFQRTVMQSEGRFHFHLKTVTLGIQCAMKLEDWKSAYCYLQWFFPQSFGSNAMPNQTKMNLGNSNHTPTVNQLEMDNHIVEAGITILSKFDIHSSSALFHQVPPTPYTLHAYLNAMLISQNHNQVVNTFKKYFLPYKVDGLPPNQIHVEPLVRALNNYPEQRDEIEKIYKIYFSNIDGTLYLGRPHDTLIEAFLTSLLPQVESSEIAREYVSHLLANTLIKFDYKKKSVLQCISRESIPILVSMIDEVMQELPRSEQLSKKYNFFLTQAAIRNGKVENLLERIQSNQFIDPLLYACSHDGDVASLLKILETMKTKKLSCTMNGIVVSISCLTKNSQFEEALHTLQLFQDMGYDISLLSGKNKEDMMQLLRTIKKSTNGALPKKTQSIIVGLEN